MPGHERQAPPEGHGEVLCAPSFRAWPDLMRQNADAADTWPGPLRALRAQARAEAVSHAERFSASIGLAQSAAGSLIAMTGHQPELYHPGVWVKDFLLQRLCDQTDALGIDLVVDTDAAEAVVLRVPTLGPMPAVREVPLTQSSGSRAYVQVPVPDVAARAAFRAAGIDLLSVLPAPALARHFDAFCAAMERAAPHVTDAAALVTAARRVYETPAGTDYRELPVSLQATTPAFRRFAAGIMLDATRFRSVVNAELAAYRSRTGTRSVAQPFPDLAVEGDLVEVPFWLLDGRGRVGLSVSAAGVLHAQGVPVASLGSSPDTSAEALAEAGLALGPKAIALTLFERLFLADLFIHGTGGGRYDRVTDAVIRSYYGIQPPAFAIASMTLMLPLGGRVTTDEDVRAAERRLQRFEHNPDELLDEIEFDTVVERAEADRLAGRKRELVERIAAPDADRKALGIGIRETNTELARLLEPFGAEIRTELDGVRAARDASAVLTDRTYPFCLWDPREVMDKVR